MVRLRTRAAAKRDERGPKMSLPRFWCMADLLYTTVEKPMMLRAQADAVKLDVTISLTIQSTKVPEVGDDIEISFLDGVVAHAAVVVLSGYNFPVIECRGKRFTLVPAGRTGDVTSEAWGTRWLVT